MAAVSVAFRKGKSLGSKKRRTSQERKAEVLHKAPSDDSDFGQRFSETKTLSMVFAGEEDDDNQPNKHFVIDSRAFVMLVNSLIILNAIEIGLSSDLRGDKWARTWKITGIFFAGSFTVEMLLKLAILRHKYFSEKWNLIDMFLVVTSLFELVVFNFVLDDTGQMGNMTIIRLFRLFKLLRLVRMFKVFQELIILLDAMIKSLQTLFWVMLLLLLAVYMFAIVCIEVIGQNDDYPAFSDDVSELDELAANFNNFQFFGTLSRSMFTLFNLITMSEWSAIARPVSELQPYMVPPILIFGMLTAFGVMNVVIGVLVEHALEASREFAAKEEDETRHKQMSAVCQVGTLLKDLDTDRKGIIDLEKMENALHSSKHFQALLDYVDLPIHVTIEELFLLMDDSGDAFVDPGEFESAMHRLIFSTDFQRMCLMQMSLNRVKHMMCQMMALLKAAPHATTDVQKDSVACNKVHCQSHGDDKQAHCFDASPSRITSQTSDPLFDEKLPDSIQAVPKESGFSTSIMTDNQTPNLTYALQLLRELREDTRIMKLDFQARFDEVTTYLRECATRRIHPYYSQCDDGESSPIVQICAPDDGGDFLGSLGHSSSPRLATPGSEISIPI